MHYNTHYSKPYQKSSFNKTILKDTIYCLKHLVFWNEMKKKSDVKFTFLLNPTFMLLEITNI